MKAHCLLDSGSKGILLSPEFMQVTGIKTYPLESPIALQLVCIGSQSMINYGAHMTIKLANVEYYEIPDTPFLRGMGITLDFKNPGMIQRGNEIIPTRKLAFDMMSKNEQIAQMSNPSRDSGPVPAGA